MDFALESTIDLKFTTRNTSGVPTTLAGTPVIDIYEDNSATQITGAETLTVDFDSITGLNNLRIVCTAANGFESGKSYSAVITTGTVDGTSVVGEVVANFSIERSASFARLGAPAGASVSADIATIDSNVDAILVDTGTTLPATLTTIEGKIDTIDTVADAILVDTGTTLPAQISALNDPDAATIADAVWDEVLTGGTHNITNSAGRRLRALQDNAGYENGAIWIDTVNGTAGTTEFENGTANNPVDSWADALTLSSSTGIKRFEILAGSTITLTGDTTGLELHGNGLWTLALGSQIVTNAVFSNASVSGTGTGTAAEFFDCTLQNSTSIPAGFYIRCGIAAASGTPLTGSTAGEYLFVDCLSQIAGSGTPYMDFSGLGATSGINIRRWSGGSNITLDSNNTLSLEIEQGGGQTITTGGANVEIRGVCRSVTIACSAAETVQFAGVTGPVTLSGTTTATINLYGIIGDVSDSTSAATVTNQAVSRETINAEADTAISDAALATAANLATVDGVVDAILVDTGTTLPGTLATLATSADLATVDGVVDAILVDTGTTIPARLDGIEGATFDTATDSLEAIRDRGDAAWTTGSGGDATEAKQDTILARLGAITGTGDNTVLGFFKALLSKVAPTPSDIGGTFDPSTDSTEAIQEALPATSTGTGARTVTVTVNDGTNPLENARVRITEGAVTYFGETDASGQITFNLDDATYTVGITKPGYSYGGTSLVITGNATPTYSMTQITTPSAPADPGLCAVYGFFETTEGIVAANLKLVFTLSGTDAAKANKVLDQESITAYTDDQGRLIDRFGNTSVSLRRNDSITPAGTTWLVNCDALNLDDFSISLTAATYDLADAIT